MLFYVIPCYSKDGKFAQEEADFAVEAKTREAAALAYFLEGDDGDEYSSATVARAKNNRFWVYDNTYSVDMSQPVYACSEDLVCVLTDEELDASPITRCVWR